MLSFTVVNIENKETVHFCGAELSSVDSRAAIVSSSLSSSFSSSLSVELLATVFVSSSLSSSFSSSLSVELLATPPVSKSGEYHTIHYWLYTVYKAEL